MGRFSKGNGSCGSGGRECRLQGSSCILGDVESEIRFFFVYCHRGKRKRERGQSIARRSNWRPVGAIRTNSRLTVTLLTPLGSRLLSPCIAATSVSNSLQRLAYLLPGI